MAFIVYDVIVTSSNIHFLGIESCEKCEISGLWQHALIMCETFIAFLQTDCELRAAKVY